MASSPLPSATASAPSSPGVASPTPEALAAAAERRFRQLQSQPIMTASQQLQLHEKRQKFRRMIDPGILRPNAKDQAMSSLKTLLTIAENLLREPDNAKFQRFKPTNTLIKRELVDRKGTLEYAIELGFRPEVKDFQPFYVFHNRHIDDLKMGTDILKEFLVLYQEKDQRQVLAKQSEKAVAQAAHERVRLAFLDDRKSKLQRDEMEKQAREAREAAAASGTSGASSALPSRPRSISVDPETDSDGEESTSLLGEGRTLGEDNAPPPYAG